MSKKDGVSSIAILLNMRSPVTVVRFIILVVVTSFKRAAFRAGSQIAQKLFKVMKPQRTNSNSTATIMFKQSIIFIKAACFHVSPCSIFPRGFYFSTASVKHPILVISSHIVIFIMLVQLTQAPLFAGQAPLAPGTYNVIAKSNYKKGDYTTAFLSLDPSIRTISVTVDPTDIKADNTITLNMSVFDQNNTVMCGGNVKGGPVIGRNGQQLPFYSVQCNSKGPFPPLAAALHVTSNSPANVGITVVLK